jgi:hypothetical protein
MPVAVLEPLEHAIHFVAHRSENIPRAGNGCLGRFGNLASCHGGALHFVRALDAFNDEANLVGQSLIQRKLVL